MKGKRSFIVAAVTLSLSLILPLGAFAAEKSLADILKEKGVITEEEYQQVKRMEEAQKAEEARKAEEAAKKAAAEKPAGLPIAGYNKGFFVQTPDENFKLNFTGYVRPMLRLYENNTSQDNEFKIERARLVLEATLGKYWQGRVSGELTTTSDGKFLKYAYLNCSYLPYLQVRAGQDKAPFSREYLTSFSEVDTIERAMITDSGGAVPKYDIGIQLHGPKLLDGIFSYKLGVFNGNGANNNDTNDDKDLVARLVLAPFAASDISALKGLEFGGSYQTGRQTPAQNYQPKLPTDWAFFKEIKYRGQRDRYGLDMMYKVGPLKLQGEWIYQQLERENQVRVNPDTHQIVSSGGKVIDAPDLISWGWYVLGTYFVWGNEEKGIQLVARYEQFDVDDDQIGKYQKANPMGKNSYANRWGNELNLRGNIADILTLGFNYFPHPNIRLAFNWFYQYLDNPYTTDKVAHAHDTGDEVPTPKGHSQQAFYLLTQVKW